MEEFKKTNLIVTKGKKVVQLNYLEELIDYVFGEEYKKLSKKDKLQKRYEQALLYAIVNNKKIVYSQKGIINKDKTIDKDTKYKLEDSFFIDNEIVFILSMCNIDSIRILEKEGAGIFIKTFGKEENDNYIFINSKCNQIIKKYIEI